MKAYEIPVSRPVYKMLKRDFGYTHFIRIDRMLTSKRMGNSTVWENYLNNLSENQTKITVVCAYAGPSKLYTVARMLENTFKTQFMLYVEAAVDHGHDASEAIRKFMDKYDLSIEELEWETAWKMWQRYRKREKELQAIPLW